MSRFYFGNVSVMLIGAQLIVLSTGLSVSLSNDAIPIGAVLAEFSTHQLHDVTLRGAIIDVQELPPYIGRLGTVRGACRFFLKDKTGMIEIQVSRNCMPMELAAAAFRGQVYEVRGLVQVRCVPECPVVSVVATEVRLVGD